MGRPVIQPWCGTRNAGSQNSWKLSLPLGRVWIFSETCTVNASVATNFYVLVDKATILLINIVFMFFMQASLNEWTYMTGFLCSLGGVCLTSLQTIRCCFIYSYMYMYVVFEIIIKSTFDLLQQLHYSVHVNVFGWA